MGVGVLLAIGVVAQLLATAPAAVAAEPTPSGTLLLGARVEDVTGDGRVDQLHYLRTFDGTLTRLTQLVTQQEIRADVHPDGSSAALTYYCTSCSDPRLAVVPVGSDTPTWIAPPRELYEAVAWSPDGSTLAVAGADVNGLTTPRTLQLFAADGSAPPSTLAALASEPVSDVAWSPGGTSVAVLRDNRRIDVVDAVSGAVRQVHDGGENLVGSVTWRDDVTLVFGQSSPRGSVVLQMAADGSAAPTLVHETGLSGTAQPHADRSGTWFAYFGGTGVVRVRGFDGSTADISGLGGNYFPARWLPFGPPPSPPIGDGPPVVSSTADTATEPGCNPAPGDCTLREAILYANANPGTDTVELATPVGGRIELTQPLPVVTAPLVVSPRGGSCPEGAAQLTIDGSAAGAGAVDGLRIAVGTDATDATRVNGLAFVDFSGAGVHVSSSRRVEVYCTALGVDAAGTPGGNGGPGLLVRDSLEVRFGSPSTGDVVAANGAEGIRAERSSFSVLGGRIGATDAAAGNASDGIRVVGTAPGAQSWIGSEQAEAAGEPSIVANGGAGVSLLEAAREVSVLGASIEGNGGLGIDLGGDGVSSPDDGDADDGPNGLLNQPAIRRVDRDGTSATVLVEVRTAPHASGTVRIHSSPACDPSGSGEAADLLGQGDVRTDQTGVGHVRIDLDRAPDASSSLSGTLTVAGATSELAPCLPADGSANGQEADLQVALEGPTEVQTDVAARYTATINNLGPSGADDVVVALDALGGTVRGLSDGCEGDGPRCTIDSIESGSSVAVELEVTPGAAEHLTLSARASSPALDLRPADNEAQWAATITEGRPPEPIGFGTIVFQARMKGPTGALTEHKLYGVGADRVPVRLTASGPAVREVVGALSPDGREVAVVAFTAADRVWRLALYRVGEAAPYRLFPQVNSLNDIEWSPDGEHLLVGGHVQGLGYGLHLLPLDGSPPRTLAARFHKSSATFSRDGTRVAASTCPDFDLLHCVVEVYAVDGSGTSVVAERNALPGERTDRLDWVRWADDDRTLLLQRLPKPDMYMIPISAVPATGGTPVDTGLESASQFLTSPDHQTVVLHHHSDSIVLMPREGGEPELLLNHTAAPDAYSVHLDEWSPATLPHRTLTVTGGGGGGGSSPVDDGCNPNPGDCTLAEAITDSNEADPDVITTIVLPPGSTVTPDHQLPTITRPVTITGDGGPTLGTATRQQCGTPSSIVGDRRPGRTGLRIAVGRDATRPTLVRGIHVARFGGDGIRVEDSAGVTFECLTSGMGAGYPDAADGNAGDGFDVRDSVDVALQPSVQVAYNGGDGLEVTGRSRRVRSLGASISHNGDLGIDLGVDGVDARDAGDADTGPNGLVNAPTLLRTTATSGTTRTVYLRAEHDVASGPYRIDVYLNVECDRSGSGEAMHWLGAGTFAGGAAAGRVLRLDLPFTVPAHLLSTSVTTGSGTSELSACLHVDGDHDPDLDTTKPGSTTPPTTTIAPVGGGTGGTSGKTDGTGGAGSTTDPRDDGAGDDDPVTGTQGDDDTRTDTPPDTTPTSEGHIVVGLTGEVTVDPAPGALGSAAGDGRLQAVRRAGGDLGSGRWSLASDGRVTLDARNLAPGTYHAAFAVIDADGDESPTVPIVFLVLAADGSVVDDHPITPTVEQSAPQPDTYRVQPGLEQSITATAGVLRNDFPGDETGLSARRIAGGTLAPARLTVGGDGSLVVDARGLAEGTYTAAYELLAGGAGRGSTSITIVVDNDNECPAVRDDAWTVLAGQELVVPAVNGVLANDRDPEGGAMTAVLVGTFQRKDIGLGPDGSVRLDARRASPGQHREFRYEAVDALGERCGTATVTIDVKENLPPRTLLNYFEVHPGQVLSLPGRGVLGNDIDPDGPETAMTARLRRGTAGLTVRADGGLTYRVPRRADVGTVISTTYQAVDGLGAASDGELRFRIVPKGQHDRSNRAPVATADVHYRVHADDVLVVPASAGVLANDSDPDRDVLFAEGLGEDDAGSRFTITREGDFTFTPTPADIGTTITQQYYAIETGYYAARSATVNVSIEVLPPRVRCTTTDNGIDLQAYDDGSNPSTLQKGTVDHSWCWDTRSVTDAWTHDAEEPVAFETSLSSSVVDTILVGMKVETDERGPVEIARAGTSRTLHITTASELCLSATDFIAAALGGINALLTKRVIGKAFAAIVKYADNGADVLGRVLQAMRNIRGELRDTLGGGFVIRAIEKVPWIGTVFAAVSDDAKAGRLQSIFGYFQKRVVNAAYDGTAGKVTGKFTISQLIRLLADRVVDSSDDIQLFADILDCNPIIGEHVEMFAPASATTRVRVRADGDLHADPNGMGPFGFYEVYSRWAWLFDIGRNGDVSLAWESAEGPRDTVFRTCDFTRIRPTDEAVPGTKLPGQPAVPCTDPGARR